MLEKELDKIHDFQKSKVIHTVIFQCYISISHDLQTSELSRRIRDAEKDVQRLVAEDYVSSPHEPHSPNDLESQQHHSYGHDNGSDDDDDSDDGHGGSDPESLDALEDRFHGLEEEVATLVADVHDLALYTKLNITGFMKILKVYYLLACCILFKYLTHIFTETRCNFHSISSIQGG